MRRVLLITYFYPPRRSIGSVRLGGLAKYLPAVGWEPIVLTAQLPSGPRPQARVIETEYRDILSIWKARLGFDATRGLHQQLGLPVGMATRPPRFHSRAINLMKRLLAYPDPMRGWIPFAIEAVRIFASVEKVDAIVSSAHPLSCHVIGRRAKALLACPWVADFRDSWAQDLNDGPLLRGAQLRRDRRTVQPADALVTVSEPLARVFRATFPGIPVHCVTNGFDPDESSPEDAGVTKTFSITYTGQLLSGKHDPAILLKVIADLVRKGLIDPAKVRLRFYGPVEAWFVASVHSLRVGDLVEINGVVPREVALARQRESQILLLLLGSTTDVAPTGVYTGKLFEYLASRRPILAVGGALGVAAELLRNTKAGIHVQSEDQLRDVIIKAYREFEQTGRVSYAGDELMIQRYTHPEMARSFAAILDSVTGGRPVAAGPPSTHPGDDRVRLTHSTNCHGVCDRLG